MNALMLGEIMRETIWIILKLSTPLMVIALGVGIIISLLQALTQIQEQTLTFVPKFVIIFICLIIFTSFLSESLMKFSQELFVKITQLE